MPRRAVLVPAVDASALPVPPQPPDDHPLRAGSVDDNADFGRFLDDLTRIQQLGVATRRHGRHGDRQRHTCGHRAHDSDGTARFLPHLAGEPRNAYTFVVGKATATVAPGGTAEPVVDAPRSDDRVALDVLFLLAGTGSIGDEIDRLTIDTVAAQVGALDTVPDVRFGMILYRDADDAFVTSTYDFTSDVEQFRGALRDVVADGGGDHAESLDEGFAEALARPSWRDPASTVQLVFLIADAPPQIARPVDATYVPASSSSPAGPTAPRSASTPTSPRLMTKRCRSTRSSCA